MATTDHWHYLLDSGLEIGDLYCFLPHRCSLQKLESINIHPLILRWITHYLYGRSQHDCVGGSSSDLQPVLCGVPQGSVLGPVLFIFYINDMSIQLMAGTMSLYADDIMFCCIILLAIGYHMSVSIALCHWTASNLLTFNATKCKYMIL